MMLESVCVPSWRELLTECSANTQEWGRWKCRSWLSIERRPEKAMAPHSSVLAWKIPWTEEPGRLQSMGSLRVRHD